MVQLCALFNLVLRSEAAALKVNLKHVCTLKLGRDSSVDIATRYWLDGLGIESRWVRDFPHPLGTDLGPPSLLYNVYRVFPGGRERPGRDADHSPHLVKKVKDKVFPLQARLWPRSLVEV